MINSIAPYINELASRLSIIRSSSLSPTKENQQYVYAAIAFCLSVAALNPPHDG